MDKPGDGDGVTITFGTKKQIDSSEGTRNNIVKLTSTTAIAIYSSTGDGLQARHLTLSGGIISEGAELTIDGASGLVNYARSAKLTDTSVLLVYFFGNTHRARVITVSGTTLTANSATNLTATIGVRFNSVSALSSTSCIYVYANSSDNGITRILSISGTAVTEGAFFQYDTTGAFNNSVVALSPTKAVVCWNDNNNSLRPTGEVLNISGTTITGNADIELSTTAGSNAIIHRLMIDALDSSKIIVGWIKGDLAKIQGIIVTESSNTLSVGALYTSSISPSVSNFSQIAVIAMTDQTAIFINTNDSGADLANVLELFISGTAIIETSDDTIGIDDGLDIWITSLSDENSIALWGGQTTGDVVEAISVSIDAPPSAALTLSIIPKPASIDASGAFIYVALLQGGTPILSKFSTALDADGSTVFNPGAGDVIGVECGRFDDQVVWIAGLFAGTDQVEKTEDAGASFVVKNVGFNNGGVFAFDVGPDSDTKMIVNNNDTQTLETTNDGATWIVRTTTNIEAFSIDRLAENTQETVFGNYGGATDSINYSINSGADIEDFMTGVFPNEDVTGVIVN